MYVRRACFVLAAALSALALAPARAAAAPPAPASSGPNRWAVLVGVENFGGDNGLALRGDLEFVQKRLGPAVGFSIVGSIGYSHWGDQGGSYGPYWDDRWDWSVNMLKGVASARFSFGNSPMIRPYADAGVGLYYAGLSGKHAVYDPYYGYYVMQDYSDSSTSLLLRLAGGVTFQLNPGFALGVEFGVHPYLGNIPDDTSTSLMASATFRM